MALSENGTFSSNMNSQGKQHEQIKWDDKHWVLWRPSALVQWEERKCVHLCVVFLYVLPPKIQSSTALAPPHGWVWGPQCMPCVPTLWPPLSDMANVNSCCAVTGSGGLLRGWWKRSCSSPWQSTLRRSQYSRKQSQASVCLWWGMGGDFGGLRKLQEQALNPMVRVKWLTSPTSAL